MKNMDPIQNAIALKHANKNGHHGAPGTLDEFLNARPFEHKSGILPEHMNGFKKIKFEKEEKE